MRDIRLIVFSLVLALGFFCWIALVPGPAAEVDQASRATSGEGADHMMVPLSAGPEFRDSSTLGSGVSRTSYVPDEAESAIDMLLAFSSDNDPILGELFTPRIVAQIEEKGWERHKAIWGSLLVQAGFSVDPADYVVSFRRDGSDGRVEFANGQGKSWSVRVAKSGGKWLVDER